METCIEKQEGQRKTQRNESVLLGWMEVIQYSEKDLNCLHFASMAWEKLTGDSRLAHAAANGIAAARGLMRHYQRVLGPTVEPSIVLMDAVPDGLHIGICVRRRLLHLNADGVQFMLADAVLPFYSNVRYYQ